MSTPALTAAPAVAWHATWIRRAVLGLTAVLNTLSLVFHALVGPQVHEWVLDLLTLLIPIAYGTVGAILWARRPGNSVGMLCSMIGLAWSVMDLMDAAAHWAANTGRITLASYAGALQPMWVVAVMLTLHLMLRLPDGRLPSPAWRWCSRLCTVTIFVVVPVLATVPGPIEGLPGTDNPFAVPALQSFGAVFALIGVTLIGATASLVVRYRRGDIVERTQLRWIAVAGVFLLAVGGSVAIFVGGNGTMPLPLGILDPLANASLPVAIGIAVTRYHLYDIDVVINRALVYGSLTASLAAVYISLVLVLQLLAAPVTHDSDLATAASTLAVAALFGPLRRRIQSGVDRRFYRSRYDAVRTLESFSARLRDEVDLETLSRDLRAVAVEAMQPAHASIWLLRAPTGRSPEAP